MVDLRNFLSPCLGVSVLQTSMIIIIGGGPQAGGSGTRASRHRQRRRDQRESTPAACCAIAAVRFRLAIRRVLTRPRAAARRRQRIDLRTGTASAWNRMAAMRTLEGIRLLQGFVLLALSTAKPTWRLCRHGLNVAHRRIAAMVISPGSAVHAR
jgi:hypothetical protein